MLSFEIKKWFIHQENKKLGPFSELELRNRFAERQIHTKTLISSQTQVEPLSLETIHDFQPWVHTPIEAPKTPEEAHTPEPESDFEDEKTVLAARPPVLEKKEEDDAGEATLIMSPAQKAALNKNAATQTALKKLKTQAPQKKAEAEVVQSLQLEGQSPTPAPFQYTQPVKGSENLKAIPEPTPTVKAPVTPIAPPPLVEQSTDVFTQSGDPSYKEYRREKSKISPKTILTGIGVLLLALLIGAVIKFSDPEYGKSTSTMKSFNAIEVPSEELARNTYPLESKELELAALAFLSEEGPKLAFAKPSNPSEDVSFYISSNLPKGTTFVLSIDKPNVTAGRIFSGKFTQPQSRTFRIDIQLKSKKLTGDHFVFLAEGTVQPPETAEILKKLNYPGRLIPHVTGLKKLVITKKYTY